LLSRILLFSLFLSFFLEARDNDYSLNSSFVTLAGARFNLLNNGDSPDRYIWLHGDEQTAKIALEDHVEEYGGIAFFVQSSTREVPFKSTIIDLNRIFSREGAYHALKKFQPYWKPHTLDRALDELDEERDSFLNVLMPSESGILIAVHNNFRGYNINIEKSRSQRVSIKDNQNPRDFIICTNKDDYEIIASGPYNVVLQNQPPENDDGSLSWEAIRRNVRYLNIETRLGQLSIQRAMLDYVAKNLD